MEADGGKTAPVRREDDPGRLCGCILDPQEPAGDGAVMMTGAVYGQEVRFAVRLDCPLHGPAARTMSRAVLRGASISPQA
jgi:hypothetical protein